MSRGLVTLVNPNKLHPPVAPYALDVLSTALEHAGFTVEVVDLMFQRQAWRDALAGYFARRSPLLVGVTIRNTDSGVAMEQRAFVPEHKEVVDEVKALCPAPIVVGGIGFSIMPHALLDYFDVDFGVHGPGEKVLCDLADAVATGRPAHSVAGLLVKGVETSSEPDRVWQVERDTAYARRSGDPVKVDNLRYFREGGLGSILTKSGCPFRCSHCVEPAAKGSRFARREVDAVVDEMEALAHQGVHDLHTADSEFNLSVVHNKKLLREIARRKDADALSPLHRIRLWIYCQPAPFDAELAELLAAAGCAGVNVGADHVRRDLLDSWKITERGTPFYTHEDTARLVRLCHEHGMLTMVEALFGMPGETLDTMRECIDAYLALDATVTSFSLGLRLYPYTKLGIALAERCDGVRTVPGLQSNTAKGPIVLTPLGRCADRVEYERQFLFDEDGDIRVVCYFSPDLPEDPETVASPTGRWRRSVEAIWEHVPASEHNRVMLPTMSGASEHDNNYADNALLASLPALGLTGAFWARWRDRDALLRRAREADLLPDSTAG